MLWWVNNVLPSTLPAPVLAAAQRYEHHVLIIAGEFDGNQGGMKRLLDNIDSFERQHAGKLSVYTYASAEVVMQIP